MGFSVQEHWGSGEEKKTKKKLHSAMVEKIPGNFGLGT